MSRRRLRAVPLLAGVLLAVLAVQLGNWQVRRAAEKTALQERYESASGKGTRPLDAEVPDEWELVSLRGKWRAAGSILLDNRVYRGRAGYHVYSPLQLADRDAWVLVNRGWVAAGRDRAALPEWETPSGEVAITGRVRRADPGAFTLGGDQAPGPVRQVLDLADYRARTGLPVADFYVQQTAPGGDGLVRDWRQSDAGADTHRGYAFQWYALAVLAAGLSGWYAWKGLGRGRGDHGSNAGTGSHAGAVQGRDRG